MTWLDFQWSSNEGAIQGITISRIRPMENSTILDVPLAAFLMTVQFAVSAHCVRALTPCAGSMLQRPAGAAR